MNGWLEEIRKVEVVLLCRDEQEGLSGEKRAKVRVCVSPGSEGGWEGGIGKLEQVGQ